MSASRAATTSALTAAASAASASSSARSFASRYGGAVNWFPGHMAKASRDVAALIHRAQADVLVEVRDARVPFSSANPHLDALMRKGDGSPRPRVIVFNKADLADPQLQGRVAAVERLRGFPSAVFADAERGTNVADILRRVDSFGTRASRLKFRAAGGVMVVVGIPNVGKSSLINAVRRAAGCAHIAAPAPTAPVPGFTRRVSVMRVRNTPPLYLCDSPGILMPKISDVETGLKLAVTTAVRDMAVPPLVLAEYLLFFFATINSARFAEVLRLSRAYDEEEVEECLGELAERHGMRKAGGGGALDLEAAARFLVRAFQGGELGRYTLDYVPRPEELRAEAAAKAEEEEG
jgi:ribosome biogenesis GTPase A